MTKHEDLLNIVKKLPTDYKPFGNVPDENREFDCSCGCKWFEALDGKLGADWGVCANPNSPRCGLLTFEHQAGLKCFKALSMREIYDDIKSNENIELNGKLRALSDNGLGPIWGVKLLRESGFNLRQAKAMIHAHDAWKDMRKEIEELHDLGEDTITSL